MPSSALTKPLPGCAHSLAGQVESGRAGSLGGTWPEVTRGIRGDFILRRREEPPPVTLSGSAELNLKSKVGATLNWSSGGKTPRILTSPWNVLTA